MFSHVSDGFQKKNWMGVGGWGELYPICFGFLEFFNFAKPLSVYIIVQIQTIDVLACVVVNCFCLLAPRNWSV